MSESGFLTWGAPQWAPAAAVLAALALAALAWSYARGRGPAGVRAAAAACKAAALAALILCLVEPLWRGERAKPGANLLVVLADNSRSMQIRDRGDQAPRGERVRRALGPDAGWLERLAETFDVRLCQFDVRLRPLDQRQPLTFDGPASALGAALNTIAARYARRPLAGVVVLTDGNVDGLSLESLAEQNIPPVYPVVVGRDPPPPDVAVSRVAVTETNFEQAPVTIQAELEASGYAGRNLIVELADQQGGVVGRQVAAAPQEGRRTSVRFQFRPKQSGVTFYEVRAAAEDEVEGLREAERSPEAVLGNNRRLAVVRRLAGPYRVLYVAGRPNWEFKFLRRAVQEDAEVQLVALLRIAKREPKFEFRGRAGERTNPLFRGFDRAEDQEAEQYDEPVLLRLGARDAAELEGGFPATAEELFAYAGLILDDVEAAFFTRDQLALIEQFVSRRGGGLIMLGGQECFAQGGYSDTPLADALPVYLRPPEAPPPADAAWRWRLTREGWLAPWLRLRPGEQQERERLGAMPAFRTVNRLERVKPGAAVLAEAVDREGRRWPALAAQRYGRGRAAALLVGDLWRWPLRREDHQNSDWAWAWRQLVRWLVAETPRPVQCAATPDPQAPASLVRIDVRVWDRTYQPLDDARVAVHITPPGGQPLSLEATPSETEPGRYEAVYAPQSSGAYRVRVVAKDARDRPVGTAECGWAHQPDADELASLRPNRQLLGALAQATGGELTEWDELERLAERLPHRKAPIREPWVRPLWHHWLVFWTAVACLIAEVGLRRWKGLP